MSRQAKVCVGASLQLYDQADMIWASVPSHVPHKRPRRTPRPSGILKIRKAPTDGGCLVRHDVIKIAVRGKPDAQL